MLAEAEDYADYVFQHLFICLTKGFLEMYDEAECYAAYIAQNPLKLVDRNFYPTTPIAKMKLSLEDGEAIDVKLKEEKRDPNDRMMYITVKEYEYYINLRSATLTLLALLLDLKTTNGIASTVLALLGVNSRALAHIPTNNGERCVLIETCRQKSRIANSRIFDEIKGCECVNNNLSCKYRIESKCSISEIQINDLFESLTEKNVLSKDSGMYKYNL